MIAHTLLPSHLLTIGLIKDIIREDISLDLLLDVLINILDLHHHLLILLQEETRSEDLFLDSLFSLIKHVLLQEKTSHKQIQSILRKISGWKCLFKQKRMNSNPKQLRQERNLLQEQSLS